MYLTTNLMPQKTKSLAESIADCRAHLRTFAVNLTTQTKIDPDDLVQDALMRAIENIDKYEPGTNLKGWLYTILKNLFINEYRRNKKLVDIELKDNMPFAAPNEAMRILSAEEIRKVFEVLPAKQRTMVELRILGYGYEEIAEKLNVPMGTVRSTLHKAKYKIQDNFKGENYGE